MQDDINEFPLILEKFEKIEDCTDYFFNEISKMDEVSNLTRREKRKLKKFLMKQLWANLNNLRNAGEVQREISASKTKSILGKFKQSIKENEKVKISSEAKQMLTYPKDNPCPEDMMKTTTPADTTKQQTDYVDEDN